MPHARKSIRDAASSLLISGATTAGTNVYVNRSTKFWQSELPAILISNGVETAEPRGMGTRESYRTFNLQIEVRVEVNDTVDDDTDAICLQVENIIKANPNLSNTCTSLIYRGTEPIYDANGEKEIGKAIMNYEIKYSQ